MWGVGGLWNVGANDTGRQRPLFFPAASIFQVKEGGTSIVSAVFSSAFASSCVRSAGSVPAANDDSMSETYNQATTQRGFINVGRTDIFFGSEGWVLFVRWCLVLELRSAGSK